MEKQTYEIESKHPMTSTEIQNILRLLSRDPHLTVRPVEEEYRMKMLRAFFQAWKDTR